MEKIRTEAQIRDAIELYRLIKSESQSVEELRRFSNSIKILKWVLKEQDEEIEEIVEKPNQ